jgi:alpha-1,2-mannosyltransferase
VSTWLNAKRLRDYPRLFFFTTWALLLANWGLHNGWLGAAGQIIGNDFLVFYSAGQLFRSQPETLYDPTALNEIQKALIAPTPLEGLIPYINPPYVAPVFSLLTFLPLGWAFVLWTGFNILCLAGAAHLLARYVAPRAREAYGLSSWQVFFIVGGYMGFVEGLQVGQNHGITLLLVSIIVLVSMRRPHIQADLAAGAVMGLLLYKPHFALAFLLVWLAWRRWYALAGFMITSAIWLGISLALQGIDPYWTYLDLVPGLVEIHQLRGSGSYLEVTLNGFLVSILGPASWGWVGLFSLALSGLAGAGIFAYAWWAQRQAEIHRAAALIFAALFPLIFAPHVLLHDSVILAVVFMLWSQYNPSRKLLYMVIAVFLAAFLLPWITYQVEIAFLGLIPVSLAAWIGWQVWRHRKPALPEM